MHFALTHFESGWAPINKLDGSVSLNSSNGCVDVFGNNIPPVQKTHSHVLAFPGVTEHHLVGWVKARLGDLIHADLLMVRLFGRNHRGVRGQWEVNAWVRNQIRLEFVQIHVEGTVETQGGSDGGNYLPDEAIQVGVRWSFDPQVPEAQFIDCLVVHHESTVAMLQCCVRVQNGVVRFHDGR